MVQILHLSAFPAAAGGGNPAGVVLDASGMTTNEMQALAARLGYAESAFLVRPPTAEDRTVGIRYFSPIAEVPFCGHATIASAVALAERLGSGPFVFETPVGPLTVATAATDDGVRASFTSVEPVVDELADGALGRLLGLLGLNADDLDAGYPPRVADAGNPHPVLVLADVEVFDGVGFDPAAVRALMDEQGWVTVALLHVASPTEVEARNIFPVGTLTEDPATGSAAAAVGGYLRALGLVDAPTDLVVRQGRHVGRPSVLNVHVPPRGGVTVSGTAVARDAPGGVGWTARPETSGGRAAGAPGPSAVQDPGPFYHGTKADLRPGDLLEPGRSSNFGSRSTASFVYLTATLDAATWGAELAVGDGPGRIYVVEPTGPVEDDPNLTDQRFPGNPTRSYRTRRPLRVVDEVADWTPHPPDVLRAMLDHLERLKALGVEAIDD